MRIWIALLRGINVVGKNIVPMRDLAVLFEALGYSDVRTYIQSGNVVFRGRPGSADGHAHRIGAGIKKRFGITPLVFVLARTDLEQAIAGNPFVDATNDPKSLHLGFLAASAEDSNLPALRRFALPSEGFQLVGRVFYLHAPEGFGTSKLAASVERILGVPVTFRNWRTVTRVAEMMGICTDGDTPSPCKVRARHF